MMTSAIGNASMIGIRDTNDARWAAVMRRDRAADGAFVYSVRTTGVYCRPSCAARLARRENVRFHADAAAAERAGFRPCKRCRPSQAASTTSPTIATERKAHAGRQAETIRVAVGRCWLGAILVAAGDRGVCAILLGDDAEVLQGELAERFAKAKLAAQDAACERVLAKVIRFVAAPGRGLDLPLDPRGTAFQRCVWRALREIPAGSTASYATIAARIGAPRSVRAVARACAANPLAVAIPCHRVLRGDGALSGYRWGVERKRALLEREGASR